MGRKPKILVLLSLILNIGNTTPGKDEESDAYVYDDEQEVDSNERLVKDVGHRLVGARSVKSYSEAPFMVVVNPYR